MNSGNRALAGPVQNSVDGTGGAAVVGDLKMMGGPESEALNARVGRPVTAAPYGYKVGCRFDDSEGVRQKEGSGRESASSESDRGPSDGQNLCHTELSNRGQRPEQDAGHGGLGRLGSGTVD